MIKLSKNKKINLAIVLFVLAALGLGSYVYVQRAGMVASTGEENQEAENQEESTTPEDEEPEEGNTSDVPAEVKYEVTGINKKDGDVLALPDEVTFKITPAVEKTKITILDSRGVVLYFEEKAATSGAFTVYPDAKTPEGAQGKIKLEGFVGSEVVVAKEIKVVF